MKLAEAGGELSSELHGVTTQKAVFDMLTAMTTPYPTNFFFLFGL
jgi:hypothetical protein